MEGGKKKRQKKIRETGRKVSRELIAIILDDLTIWLLDIQKSDGKAT